MLYFNHFLIFDIRNFTAFISIGALTKLAERVLSVIREEYREVWRQSSVTKQDWHVPMQAKPTENVG
jgi:hypothetical protein